MVGSSVVNERERTLDGWALHLMVVVCPAGWPTRPFQNGLQLRLLNAALSLVESLVLTQMLASDWLLGATVLERTGLRARADARGGACREGGRELPEAGGGRHRL